MGERHFLSWPAGWRQALPWGVLVGVIVAGAATLAQGWGSGWQTLDRLFWCDLAILFPCVVVGFTVLTARRWAARKQDEQANPKTPDPRGQS
jgi:hypothetical protein